MKASAVIALAFTLAGCASAAGPQAAAPACGVGDAMVETQLFFGMNKPKGGTVSAKEWERFVAAEVTPRFPEGFSVIDGSGFWRDEATKRTISEKSKIVVRLHPATDDADKAIGAIAEAYKIRFEQDAVLRVDRPVCAQF